METSHAPWSTPHASPWSCSMTFGHGGDVGVRLWDGTRWPDDRPRRDAGAPSTRVPCAPCSGPYRTGAVGGVPLRRLRRRGRHRGHLADTSRTHPPWTRKASPIAGPAGCPGRSGRRRPGAGPAPTAEALRGARPRGHPVPLRRVKRVLPAVPRRSDGLPCGYFAHAATDLESAQLGKLDLLAASCAWSRAAAARIGCGWGGLVMHAARATASTPPASPRAMGSANWPP